jgi:hypothetical protein
MGNAGGAAGPFKWLQNVVIVVTLPTQKKVERDFYLPHTNNCLLDMAQFASDIYLVIQSK